MRAARITRGPSTDEGTFGNLVTDAGNHYHSGELPWRDDQPGLSCIRPGTYRCSLYDSPTHGLVFKLQNVPGHTYVEIHGANWCGDKLKGLKCQLLGCICLGTDIGELEGQRAVLHSQKALQLFMDEMGPDDFELTIE